MDKKAGVSISLKFIIGLVIATIIILILLPIAGNFIIFGKEKKDPQINFFNELNEKITSLETNKPTEQIFELKDNSLLVSFNNQNSEINLKDIEVYTGNKKDFKINLKKQPQCKNCLCLCKTKDDNILLEDDCLEQDDLCTEQEKEITSNNQPFFLFGKGIYNLKIEKTFDKVNIIIIKNE